MKEYIDLLKDVILNGEDRPDRTGTGTRSVFGRQIRIDLRKGFPLLTTKNVYFKGVVLELLWMLRGHTESKWLEDRGCKIWAAQAGSGENHPLGPIYGEQWRRWRTINSEPVDQITAVIKSIRENPNSRRHIVNAWNPSVLPDEYISPSANVDAGRAALPPCHAFFQFYVGDGGTTLSCHLYQRSADIFLGVPFNIASYALLTHIVAHITGLIPKELITSYGDIHIYKDHLLDPTIVKEQLSRDPLPLPTLYIVRKEKANAVEDFELKDFNIVGYTPHPRILAKMSV